MKIGIVCYPTFGGSGVVATELGMELSKRGHQVHFITYKQPVRLAHLSNQIHYHQVNVPEYPLFHYQPYELALSSKLVDMVKLHQIEILHVHYAIPHAYAGYMAKKMLQEEGIEIPMVTTLHGTDITLVGNHPFYKPAVTFSINKSDCVTSVSQSLKDDTLRLFNVTNDIQVIHNFIDIHQLRQNFEDCQRSVMAKDDERIVTHISNFRKVKRVKDVVKVFATIRTQLKAKLIMVGDGPQLEPAKKMDHDLGIREHVLFMGESTEINKILCYSDLFILPSEAESFGFAALEAMANGVPVISSNAGGLPEVNRHGYSGYLSKVGDTDEMAANAINILKDDAVLKQYKEQAKTTAAAFDISIIVPQYEKIYQKAMSLYK